MSRIPNQSDLVDLELTVLVETTAAYRVTDGTKTVWIPKSQCERDGDTFTMPEWLGKEKGLI